MVSYGVPGNIAKPSSGQMSSSAIAIHLYVGDQKSDHIDKPA
jgi:hypothetical protein